MRWKELVFVFVLIVTSLSFGFWFGVKAGAQEWREITFIAIDDLLECKEVVRELEQHCPVFTAL